MKFDMKAYLKEYRRTHKKQLDEQRRLYYPKYYESHRDAILQRSRVYYQEHKEQKALYRYQHSQALKVKVLTHYGNGKLACVRCGYSNIDALSIDHIDGNGCSHRHSVGKSSYSWLKSHNFPSGYQTLCMNCQYIKKDENEEYANQKG